METSEWKRDLILLKDKLTDIKHFTPQLLY